MTWAFTCVNTHTQRRTPPHPLIRKQTSRVKSCFWRRLPPQRLSAPEVEGCLAELTGTERPVRLRHPLPRLHHSTPLDLRHRVASTNDSRWEKRLFRCAERRFRRPKKTSCYFVSNLQFKVEMYVFDGLLLFITQKRPLKVKKNQNSLMNKRFSLIEP